MIEGDDGDGVLIRPPDAPIEGDDGGACSG